jgi:ElaB/YqjD/DUF883 family membrane-anchored ribosome-binding protein
MNLKNLKEVALELKKVAEHLPDTITKSASAVDDESVALAERVADLLVRNNKIDARQRDEVMDKLLNHRKALELFYSNEKMAGEIPYDSFGTLKYASAPKRNKKENESDVALDAFLSELLN